ncbi:MAG: TonB family protein [Cyclobacteriaceae bacterium]
MRYYSVFTFFLLVTQLGLAQPDTLRAFPEHRVKGGADAFYKLTQNTLRYPGDVHRDGIMGTAIVSFVLTPDGEITDIKIVNSLGQDIDALITSGVSRTKELWRPDSSQMNDYILYLPVIYIYNDIPFQQTVHQADFLLREIKLLNFGETRSHRVRVKIREDHFLYERAITHFHDRKYKKAIPHLDELIRRDPFNKDYYMMRAFSRYQLGNKSDACLDYQKIRTLLHRPIPDAAQKLCQ